MARINKEENKSTMFIMVLAIVALLAVVAYSVMFSRENRTFGEKAGDAVENISDGFEKAGRSMQDRTPAEKLGDAVKDAGDDIKKSVD